MAVQDISAADQWLKETYIQKEFFQPYQEMYTPLLTDLEECPDEPVQGRRWNVPLYIATAWNVRTGAEGGAQASVVSDTVVQGQVTAQEFKGTVQLTELLNRVGTEQGHFDGGALDHQMKQRTAEMAKLMQIMFWQHGTGRLARVDVAQPSGTTLKLRLPWGFARIRKNMRIDGYNADTAGSSTFTNKKITKVDRSVKGDGQSAGYNTYLGEITLDAAVTANAGDHIYLTGDYGYGPNGIDGLVSNSATMATFLTQSRTNYPELNAVVNSNSGTPRDLTEDLMQAVADELFYNGSEIDSIRCNAGMMRKYAQLSVNDRRYNITKGEFPKYIQGQREGDLLFAYDKVTTVVKKDPQCAFRTMKFLNLKDTFYKHTVAPIGFREFGGQVLMPIPSSGGGGYDYSIQAQLYAAANISCFNPQANASLDDLKDAQAGD